MVSYDRQTSEKTMGLPNVGAVSPNLEGEGSTITVGFASKTEVINHLGYKRTYEHSSSLGISPQSRQS